MREHLRRVEADDFDFASSGDVRGFIDENEITADEISALLLLAMQDEARAGGDHADHSLRKPGHRTNGAFIRAIITKLQMQINLLELALEAGAEIDSEQERSDERRWEEQAGVWGPE